MLKKLLKKFNYFDVKHVSTPYDSSIKLKKNLNKGISSHKYSQIIGSLLHLIDLSRPDFAYAVGTLGRSENNIVDPLTKELTCQQVLKSSRGMRLEPII